MIYWEGDSRAVQGLIFGAPHPVSADHRTVSIWSVYEWVLINYSRIKRPHIQMSDQTQDYPQEGAASGQSAERPRVAQATDWMCECLAYSHKINVPTLISGIDVASPVMGSRTTFGGSWAVSRRMAVECRLRGAADKRALVLEARIHAELVRVKLAMVGATD